MFQISHACSLEQFFFQSFTEFQKKHHKRQQHPHRVLNLLQYCQIEAINLLTMVNVKSWIYSTAKKACTPAHWNTLVKKWSYTAVCCTFSGIGLANLMVCILPDWRAEFSSGGSSNSSRYILIIPVHLHILFKMQNQPKLSKTISVFFPGQK